MPLTTPLLLWALLSPLVAQLPSEAAELAAARADYVRGDYAASLARLERLDAANPAPPAAPLALALVESLVAQDKLDAAGAHAQAALLRAEQGEDTVAEGTLHRWLGLVAALEGRAEEARAHDWQALMLHEAAGAESELVLDRLSLAADEYPRSPELAYSIWAEVAESAAELGDAEHELMALKGLLSVLLRWGEIGWAEVVLGQARRAQLASGTPASAMVDVELYAADIAQLQGQHAQAVERVRAALAARPQVEWDRFARTVGASSLGALGQWEAAAELLDPVLAEASGAGGSGVVSGLDALAITGATVARHRGRMDEARRHAGLARRHLGEAPETRARLLVEEAALALHDSDRPAATRRLEEAVAALESLRRSANADLARGFYSADMAESLETLVGLYGVMGDAADLQRIGELLKGAALASQLERDAIARPPEDARLPADRPPPAPIAPHAPSGRLATASLQAALPPGAAMLDYYILPESAFVLWMTRDVARVFPLPTSRAPLVAAVDETMALLRGGRDAGPGLKGLAHLLLEPVAPTLAQAAPARVFVAPHGVLHMFPFEALPVAGGRLVDVTAVAYLPTPGVLRGLRRSAPARTGRTHLVLGDPTRDLPEARAEASEVAKLLGVVPLLGAQATRAALSNGPIPSVLHIAGHGHQSWSRDGAWLSLADGPISPREIRSLALPGALVVLSACESGIAPVSAGDEMPEALDRSFLAAGAEAVVSTRWAVSDRAARDLMTRFYDRLVRADRPRAEQAWAEAVRSYRAGHGAVVLDTAQAVRGMRLPTSSPTGSPDRLEHWAAFKVVVAPRRAGPP